jgi:hypothetical protein
VSLITRQFGLRAAGAAKIASIGGKIAQKIKGMEQR